KFQETKSNLNQYYLVKEHSGK
ncbi:unnamed protein product, partial [Allacma fusca]